MVEELTNQAAESLRAEALLSPPGERLLTAISANQRDYPTFAEVVAQTRAKQTPAQARDLSMDSEVGYELGLALRATFHNFGDAAQGRAAYARDPDQGYKIPHPRNLTWETEKAAAEPQVREVAPHRQPPKHEVAHGHHPRHKITHAEVVEHIPAYRGTDYSPRLSVAVAAI